MRKSRSPNNVVEVRSPNRNIKLFELYYNGSDIMIIAKCQNKTDTFTLKELLDLVNANKPDEQNNSTPNN